MMSLGDLIPKRPGVTLTEHGSAESHFNDLGATLGELTPTDAGSTGESYMFENKEWILYCEISAATAHSS